MKTTTTPHAAHGRRYYSMLATAALLGAAAPLVAQSDGSLDPYTTVEAEDYDLESGTRTGEFAGAVGYIEDGDYIAFEDVDFGRGPLSGEVRASSDRAGGRIEFRTGSPDGILVAEAEVGGTGGWSAFVDFPVEVVNDYGDGTAFLGTRDLYLVFRGARGYRFDVDAFSFVSADVPATGVEFVNCPTTLRPLTVGDAFDLEAEVLPAGAINRTVFYSSSDEDVVEVVDITTGEVRAVGAGTATITATALDGGFVDSCAVRVRDRPIDPYLPVLGRDTSAQRGTRPGETRTAVGYIEDGDYLRFNRVAFGRGPAGGTVRASSGRGGGTVEFRVGGVDGLLIAESAIAGTGGWSAFGDFPIEVFEDYGDGTAFLGTRDLFLVFRGGKGFLFDVAEFTFTSADVAAAGVEIVNCPAGLTVGESFVLQADVSPADAVNQNVSFNSGADGIVRIDDLLFGEITAVAPGTSTITVTTYDGGYSDQCVIEVAPAPAGLQAPHGKPGGGVHALDAATLLAYPNPSPTGAYRLSDDAPTTSAQLYDASGRAVRRVGLTPGASVDLTDLPDGRYLLRAESGATGVLVKGG